MARTKNVCRKGETRGLGQSLVLFPLPKRVEEMRGSVGVGKIRPELLEDSDSDSDDNDHEDDHEDEMTAIEDDRDAVFDPASDATTDVAMDEEHDEDDTDEETSSPPAQSMKKTFIVTLRYKPQAGKKRRQYSTSDEHDTVPTPARKKARIRKPVVTPSPQKSTTVSPASGVRESPKLQLVAPELFNSLKSNNAILRSHNVSLSRQNGQLHERHMTIQAENDELRCQLEEEREKVEEVQGYLAQEGRRLNQLLVENERLRVEVKLGEEVGMEWARRVEVLEAKMRAGRA